MTARLETLAYQMVVLRANDPVVDDQPVCRRAARAVIDSTAGFELLAMWRPDLKP